MADALEPEDTEDRKLCERLAGRVGRQVEGVALVRPAVRDGWLDFAGFAMLDESLGAVLTGVAVCAATVGGQERRRARAMGVETRMVLALTEHEAHLFRARARGRILGDHVMALPYGTVSSVVVGKWESARLASPLIKVTIRLTDGSTLKLRGEVKQRRVFEQFQARAAAVSPGTVPPPPTQRPDPAVARVLATAASHVAKGAISVRGQVRAARSTSK
jgi:hypothetical protein